ncbi:MAG: ribbon-helix-helix protein, CopG family, partial [Pseudomonadota bacterium]
VSGVRIPPSPPFTGKSTTGSISSMKLSISLPEQMAKEIKKLAKSSERSASWWIQRAWVLAKPQLQNPEESLKAKKAAMAKIDSLEGALKRDFPSVTSVELSKKAFSRNE